MKKFLTLLLALSVVFTYTVGTAFAAQTTDEKGAAVARDLKLATDVLDAFATKYIADAKVTGTYSDAAIEYAVKATKDLGLLFINNYSAAKAAEPGDYAGTPVVDDLNKWLKKETTVAAGKDAYVFTGVSFEAKYTEFVAAKDFEVAKAAALAKVTAIDTSIYYVNEDKTVDNVKAAKDLKDAAEIAIKAVKATGNTIAGTTPLKNDATYAEAINAYLYGCTTDASTIHTSATPMSTQVNADVKGLMAKLDALKTIEEQKIQDAKDKENVGFAVSELNTFGKVTFYKANRVDADTDVTSNFAWVGAKKELNGVAVKDSAKITAAEATAANAALMKRIDNTLEVLTVYLTETPSNISEVVSTTGGLLTNDGFEAAITAAEAAIARYDAAVTEGVAKKSELDPLTGAKKYDDAQVDQIIAKYRTTLYASYKTPTNISWANLTEVSDAVAKAIAEAKAKFTSGKEADKKYTKAYYDTDTKIQAKVDVLFGKAKDALTEAKSVAEVDQIMADLDKALAEIRTAEAETAVKKAIADAKYSEFFTSYATAQAALKGDDYRAGSFTEAKTAALELVNTAKAVSELPALFEKGKALFDTIKKDADIKAAAKTVADMIAALPTKATLAERDALLAAKKAYNEFDEIFGAESSDVYNNALLTAKLVTLKATEIKSIQDAVTALPSTLTDADVAKVEAIRAELEKYLVEYEMESYTYDGKAGDFQISETTYNALVAAETKVAALKVEAVKKLIFALPAEVKLADKAAVEAARKAFDALSKTDQATLISNGYYAKLAKAETQIAVLEAAQNAKIINGVKNTTIKVSTVAYKGYNKINWKKSYGYKVDGYQVYKSTKKTTGTFKFMGSTTKTTMKNAKGLKKGTKYYYKVRGYRMIDGVKVYTKWSNLGIRTAK